MIPISQIDPELSIYKENTVVIWGAGKYGREIFLILRYLGVDISYFCDNLPQKWGTRIWGVPVISPDELKKLIERNESSFLVQLALYAKYEPAVYEQVKQLGISTVIQVPRSYWHFILLNLSNLLEENPRLKENLKKIEQEENTEFENEVPKLHYADPRMLSHLVVCQIGKTGDTTLTRTYSKHTSVEICHGHNPSLLDFSEVTDTVVKVITGIRDPIARDISALYELLANGTICFKSDISIEEFGDFLLTENPQHIFDKITKSRFSKEVNGTRQHQNKTFFSAFKESVVDLYEQDFNQETGYTIIKEGNIEVFFYQLEKLNDIVPQLSEWIGVPFDKLERANEASSKWIANSYKQAQKELKFSQEYFDMCYNDPYVQHCYSQEDIEKFKDRWRKNIDPNK